MTVKISLRQDWHSEDQRVNQATTDRMIRGVCTSSTISIGNSISCRHCPPNSLGPPPPVSTSDDKCLQELGSVETIQGRCVAFPNVYQHQVQPFRLEDPTKPGVRKIFVAFLVDPTYTIPSATIVAPQQREVIREAMVAMGDSSWLSRLPTELIDIISCGNDGTMSRAEAEAYRLELMNERTVFVEASDSSYFGQEFNMWYVIVFLSSQYEGITKIPSISEH